MSKTIITLTVEKRIELGKAVKGLRKEGLVPLSMYERGHESQNLKVRYADLEKAYRAAGKHHAIELLADGKKHLVMIKEVDIDPIKGTIKHIALHAIKQNEVIEAEVPVRLDGNAPAAARGLLVRANIDTLVVRGIPGNIPDQILVDISAIETEDDDIRVQSIVVAKDVEIVTDPETIIVSVVVPRSEIEKESEEAEAVAANVPSDNGSKQE